MLGFIAWIVTWILGAVLFDVILGVRGPLLMGAGVLTYFVCEAVEKLFDTTQEE